MLTNLKIPSFDVLEIMHQYKYILIDKIFTASKLWSMFKM